MITFHCTDEEECMNCHGSGQQYYANDFEGGGYEECSECHGQGLIATEKTVTIQQLKDLIMEEAVKGLPLPGPVTVPSDCPICGGDHSLPLLSGLTKGGMIGVNK